ncbi:MAG: YncE family protein [Dehalococcoidia bacterium]
MLLALSAALVLAGACDDNGEPSETPTPGTAAVETPATATPDGDDNVYAHTGVGALSPAARRAKSFVYVPNSESGTVTIIDPITYKALITFPTDESPQHVVPSYDFSTLWVTNNGGYSLTLIDPKTGAPGPNVEADDPYNLYFTPDGRFAIVVAEELKRLDFHDAQTMEFRSSLAVECEGVNHLDYTADGRYAVATCEFSGQLVQIDIEAQQVIDYLTLDSRGAEHAMPQDIRLSPDGSVFFVADMMTDGVHVIEAASFEEVDFIATGVGAHSIIPGRGGDRFYVTNRGWNTVYGGTRGPGSVSVLDPESREVLETWPVPDGGSPDMGALTPEGNELWLSGRFDSEVYVFDVETGDLTHRIPVERGPHGLCVWPQPGRYSLGHNGNMR